MLQNVNKKQYRIIAHKNNQAEVEKGKIVAFSINAPVLNEYNKLDLLKNSRYQRIRHTSTIRQQIATKQGLRKYMNQFKAGKWEETLSKYIESKQKIQCQKGILNSHFQFHPLDKINRLRYNKLVKQESLPSNINKSADLSSDNFSMRQNHQSLSTSYKLKGEQDGTLKEYFQQSEEELLRRLPFPKQKRMKTELQSQEKILVHFIQNYFKNKYKMNQNNKMKIKNKQKTIQNSNSFIVNFPVRTNTD